MIVKRRMLVRLFWQGFCKSFKQATLIWLLSLLIFAFLGIFYWSITWLPEGISSFYRVSFLILCILFYMGYQYVFPMVARYRMKTGHLLKNAWLLSVAALPWTAIGVALTAGAVYVTFLMDPEALGSTLTILVFGFFGVQAYLKSLCFHRAFRRLQPQK